MSDKIVKEVVATTTVADAELGQFEAVVSGWTDDREKDTIDQAAFNKTIAAWQASGKMLPMLFNHSTEGVGYFDPATMRATEAGLVASGQVDRDTDNGAMVWRQIKNGSAGFSVGFMGDGVPNAKGGKHWTEIDLLEISATSTPMHPATRTLSWKAATATATMPVRRAPAEDELRERAKRLGLDLPYSATGLRRRADAVELDFRTGQTETGGGSPQPKPPSRPCRNGSKRTARPAAAPMKQRFARSSVTKRSTASRRGSKPMAARRRAQVM